jgi:hypothetical protein
MTQLFTGWRLAPFKSAHQSIFGAFARITVIAGWNRLSGNINLAFNRTRFFKTETVRACGQVKGEQTKKS